MDYIKNEDAIIETRGSMVVTDSVVIVTDQIDLALAGILEAVGKNQNVFVKPGFVEELQEDARFILAYDAVKNITPDGVVEMPRLPATCGAFSRPKANTGLAVCALLKQGGGNGV